MKIVNLILIIAIMSSCGSKTSTTDEEIVILDNLSSNEKDTIIQESKKEVVKVKKTKRTDFDFLSECDSLEIWKGGIQGTTEKQKTCCYIMAQCFSNKHYDVIVFNENDLELNVGSSYQENRINDNLVNTTYFAFEIPKKVPESPENEFDTFDYIYPSEVKIYQKFSDGWYLIETIEVSSFEELGELKLKTIMNAK